MKDDPSIVGPRRAGHVRDGRDVLRRPTFERDLAQKAARRKTEPLSIWRYKRRDSALRAGNRLPVDVVSTAQVDAIARRPSGHIDNAAAVPRDGDRWGQTPIHR